MPDRIPIVVFDSSPLTEREKQIVQTLIRLQEHVLLASFDAAGADLTLEQRRHIAEDVVSLMLASFPDVSFWVEMATPPALPKGPPFPGTSNG